MIIKLKGQQQTVNSTPASINSRVLRCWNDTGASEVITIRDAANNIVGSTTVGTKSEIIIEKNLSDTIECDNDVIVSPISYTIS